MPMWLHILLSCLFTLYFIFRFVRDKYFYQLIFVLWIPSTLLVYVPFIAESQANIRILGIAQVVLFILVIFFMFRRRGAQRHKTLEMLSQMAADRLPDEDTDEAGAEAVNADTTNANSSNDSTANDCESEETK